MISRNVQMCISPPEEMSLYVTSTYTANAYQKISSSPHRKEKFAKACLTASVRQLQILYDVPTRWNSAYTMLERALHMRRAITLYLTEERDLAYLTLSNPEWDQCGALLTILYPFKVENTRIQQTERPTIHRVYWSYERMFNTIDELRDDLQNSLARGRRKDRDWIAQLLNAINEMERKLKAYYAAAAQCVFSEACLLDPVTKTSLFESGSFIEDVVNWKQQYIDAARERFETNYQNMHFDNMTNGASTVAPAKRRRNDDEDDDDEFRRRIIDRQGQRLENEFDRYMQLPLEYDSKPLDSWRKNQHDFPHLAQMFRDVYAAPASGAGVEREFSKGGRVASWTRSRLDPETVSEIMLYKSYLARQGKAMEEMEDDVGISDADVSEEAEIQKLTREFTRSFHLLE